METKKELNKEIVELRMKIREKYPELEDYHAELQLSIPDNADLDLKALREYRDTLRSVLTKYQSGQHSK